MCLRGLDTLTAAGLRAEVGALPASGTRRRSSATSAPFRQSSPPGDRRRRWRGPITKSGSQHAHRLVVEAAWHYRRAPRVAGSLARRQRGGEPETLALSWNAPRL
jgi:transposase